MVNYYKILKLYIIWIIEGFERKLEILAEVFDELLMCIAFYERIDFILFCVICV